MSIPISDIIQVDIAVSPNAIAVEGFGPLLFMSKEFVPTLDVYPVRQYTSLAAVQADFPTGEIANAATTWYSQKPRPKTFLVGAVVTTTVVPATVAKLAASTAATLPNLQAVTNGQMTIDINSVPVSIQDIDLSAIENLAEAATIVQEALGAAGAAAGCNQDAGKFAINTIQTGSSRSVGNAVGTLAVALKLDSASNPVATAGTDEKSLAGDLAKVAESPYNFFYVALERSLRGISGSTDSQMLAAKWCEASSKVFGWADSDKQILVTGAANSFRRAKSQNLRNTLCVYDASVNGNEYPEIAILARAATVNFNVANSALILAFKKGPGVVTADLSPGQVAALQSVNGNAFISVGGNTMFWNGKMADGTWFDTVQGIEWLTQKVRLNVFNLFYTSNTKIPWTDTGVAMVNQQVTLALELARTNGLIAPGYDNEGEFYPDGYKVISTDLELLQSQKGSRIWEGTSFIAIGSGALQGAVITGNFIQ